MTTPSSGSPARRCSARSRTRSRRARWRPLPATRPCEPPATPSPGGADASLFEVGAETGTLVFVAVPDYERPADADGDNAYELAVEASSDSGDLLLSVTVTVTDDDTEAPAVPAAPTATPTAGTVTLSWEPPDNTGPAITAYEVQYRTAGDTDWTGWPHTGADTAATITGLAPETSHELRVRAVNPEGAGEWSPAAVTVTASATDPSEGQDQ